MTLRSLVWNSESPGDIWCSGCMASTGFDSFFMGDGMALCDHCLIWITADGYILDLETDFAWSVEWSTRQMFDDILYLPFLVRDHLDADYQSAEWA